MCDPYRTSQLNKKKCVRRPKTEKIMVTTHVHSDIYELSFMTIVDFSNTNIIFFILNCPLDGMWTINALMIIHFVKQWKCKQYDRKTERNKKSKTLLLFSNCRTLKTVMKCIQNRIKLMKINAKLCVIVESRFRRFECLFFFGVFVSLVGKFCIFDDWISSLQSQLYIDVKGPVASAWLDLQSFWKSYYRIEYCAATAFLFFFLSSNVCIYIYNFLQCSYAIQRT